MLWSKLKNLILAVLLLTNLFLLGLVLSEAVEEDSLELEALSNAIAFLEQRNIQLPTGDLPRELGILPQQLLWSRSEEPSYGEALLGSVEEESLGGEIVRYYNPQGELRFHDNGEFYGSFSAGFLPMGEKNLQDQGEDLMNTLGYQGIFLESSPNVADGTGNITFLQTLDQIPLLDCETTLRYEDGFLREITQGKRLEGEFSPRGEERYLLSTALMQFYQGLLALELTCEEILNISPCYLVSTPLSSPAQLTPAWYFSTSEGDFVLDATTGILEYKGELS